MGHEEKRKQTEPEIVKYVLMRDLVIPKGAIFQTAKPRKIENPNGGLIESQFILSPHTSGSVMYGIDADPATLNQWFRVAGEVEKALTEFTFGLKRELAAGVGALDGKPSDMKALVLPERSEVQP